MWIEHPDFDSNRDYNNDIGLVYCPQNTIRSGNVRIAYLYLQDPTETSTYDLFYKNQIVEIAGWGRTSQTESLFDTLKYTEQKIIDIPTCRTSYPTMTFGPERICIAKPNTNIQVSFT
jgi:hypothetical protein